MWCQDMPTLPSKDNNTNDPSQMSTNILTNSCFAQLSVFNKAVRAILVFNHSRITKWQSFNAFLLVCMSKNLLTAGIGMNIYKISKVRPVFIYIWYSVVSLDLTII